MYMHNKSIRSKGNSSYIILVIIKYLRDKHISTYKTRSQLLFVNSQSARSPSPRGPRTSRARLATSKGRSGPRVSNNAPHWSVLFTTRSPCLGFPVRTPSPEAPFTSRRWGTEEPLSAPRSPLSALRSAMVVTAELIRDKLLEELEAVHVVCLVSNTCLFSLNDTRSKWAAACVRSL